MTRRPRTPGHRPSQAHIRPAPGPRPTSAYSAPLDAVVLAGADRNRKGLILGRNKAFLKLRERILIQTVTEALLRAASVDRIFVVGPLEPLEDALRGYPSRVRMVDQAGSMLGNSWTGYEASRLLRQTAGGTPDDPDRPALFLSCDLPLASPEALDDFIARCSEVDRRSSDPTALLVGVAEEASLLAFYPSDGKPGIVRPTADLRSGRYRLANVYVARPYRMGHREMLQTGFSYRKAKDWRNVLALAGSFFRRPGGWKAASLILRLEATLLASGRSQRLHRWLRRRNTIEQVEDAASVILGGPVRLVNTPFGGLSLDVDDEEDYRIIVQRLEEWSGQAADSSALPA